MKMDYLIEQMTQIINGIIEKNHIAAEKAISEYMTKHDLFIHDIEKHGVVEHFPDKIVYKYKDDIICEISMKIETTISYGKVTITSEEIPEPHTMLNYSEKSETPPSVVNGKNVSSYSEITRNCSNCGTMLRAHCNSCQNFSRWIKRNY